MLTRRAELVARTLDDLRVGDVEELEYDVRDEDVHAFAELTGDRSPLHVDDAFARTTRYGKRVAHGMLVAAPVSTLVGMRLPGRHAIFAGLRIDFTAPVRPGDRLRLRGTVRSVSSATRMIVLELDCRRMADDRQVLRGEARVLVEPHDSGSSAGGAPTD